jgi:diguanylate cyclase (GGDEF)-like protein
MAFAGAVLANIVPVLLSFDEIDLLRENMRRIEDTNRVSRQARAVADIVPRVLKDFSAGTLSLSTPEREQILAQTAGDVERLSQSLDRLLVDARDWMSPDQHIALTAAAARISEHWRTLRIPAASGVSSVAIYRDLVSDTDSALAVLRDVESKTFRKSATITALVFEHLTVTGALLAGAIAIGFSINAFGSMSIFRALNREQESNEALEQAKSKLRERSEQLSEAHRLGKLGDWHILVPSGEIRLGAETYELLGLDPKTFQCNVAGLRGLFSRDGFEHVRLAQIEVLKSGEARSVDTKIRRGDGTTGDFTMTCKALTDPEGRVVQLFGTLQDISERKAAEVQLEAIAYYDPLTGLANRALFSRELEAALAQTRQNNAPCALLLLDLDRFKEINDTLGHATGDELLTRVAHIVSRVLGPHSFLARLGGDEFAVILRGLDDEKAVAAIASEIVQSLSGSLMLDKGEVGIGTSIGIVMAPKQGRNASDLLRNADLALYKAKEDGRGRFAFFTPDLDTIVQNKTALANDLRRAVASNTGLYIHYQPQYEFRTGEIAGFEALMRWTHPVRGDVSPGEFIPIAESSSLICDLGNWILREGALQAKQWLDEGHAPRTVSINVSPAQIWHSDFVSEVARILKDTGLPPHLLCLELTESLMADHGEGRVRKALKALKMLGVTLALDDFGTDYSSLGYLAQLPFDKLKIDRIFINGISNSHRSRELLKGIIALGRGLGMEVVAEGAETADEVEILRSLQCDIVQGYAFGPALPPREAMAFAKGYDQATPMSVPAINRSAYEASDDLADDMISRLRAVVA